MTVLDEDLCQEDHPGIEAPAEQVPPRSPDVAELGGDEGAWSTLASKPVVSWHDVPGMLGNVFVRRDDKQWAARRRQFPIAACVGSNGGGKSMIAVHDILPSLEVGRPVLSTVRFLDYENPRPCPGGASCDDPANHLIQRYKRVPVPDMPGHWEEVPSGRPVIHSAVHPLYIKLTDYQQLLDFRSGDVLLDEVTGIASSRESQSMPAPIANWLVQLRKRDIRLTWTTPNWARADKIMREVTQIVTNCYGMAAVRATDEGGAKIWGQRRMFLWKSYDASQFDDWTSNKRDKVESFGMQRFYRPGSKTERAYDTLDTVAVIGATDDSGRCLHCHKQKKKEYCAGH